MPSLRETAALVALLRDGARPWTAYAALVEEAGSAVAVLESDRAQTRLFSETGDEQLMSTESEITAWIQDGIEVLTVLDERYPDNLRAVHDRPPLIFVAGSLAASDARSVAVVGARLATERGIATATATARHLVQAGYVVISGLATGIDTAAHTAAVACGGRTLAVIGTGLRRFYPPENAQLQRRLATEHAVVSQFWPDSPPSKRSFPMRNAVMSGLSLATVIVEAGHTSGSRIQGRLALEHGRPVFLWRSLLSQPWAKQLASRPGTYVVSAPEEITATVERMTSSGALVA